MRGTTETCGRGGIPCRSRKRTFCRDSQSKLYGLNDDLYIQSSHLQRRRSMLPKMYSSSIPLPSGLDRDQSGDGDRSVDDASTCKAMVL